MACKECLIRGNLSYPLLIKISDENIAKTVNSLPRTEDNSGMVLIGLKRKLNMTNYHKYGLINPDRVYEACRYLIENHPDYKNIKLLSYDDWAKKLPSLFNPTKNSDSEESEDSSSDDIERDDKSDKEGKKQKEIVEGKAIIRSCHSLTLYAYCLE